MPPQTAPVIPGLPPPPAPQVGAEAPIAAPENSGRNLLAQLGISGSALERLDVARQRSDATTQAAMAQVATNQDEMAALTAPLPPRAPPPTLDEVPKAPTQAPTDPLRVFGQVLPVLAMLGGAFVRNNATAALRAGAAAMQAARDNDEQALETAHQQWTDSLQAITTNNATRLQQYQAILDDTQLTMDERMARLQALAASEQNALRLQQLASGQVSELTEGVMMELRANEILTDAFLRQQEINAAQQGATAADFGDVLRLRQEYARVTGDISTIENNYNQIQALAERAGSTETQGPADIGLIFSYMKMLDPGSTVREGEYANAQNSGSVPQSVTAMYNRLLSGGRLAPEVRQEFVDSANVIAAEARARRSAFDRQYTDLALANGFEPSQVIVSASVNPDLPPAGQRRFGQGYTMSDGTTAYWNGEGFDTQPPIPFRLNQ